MDRNVPGGMRRQHLIVGEDCKELLARPDTLLIDDNEKNISAFRKSGGMAITVPRPWNRLRGCANTSLYLKGMFEIIFGRRAA
jgi:hypothetical protein